MWYRVENFFQIKNIKRVKPHTGPLLIHDVIFRYYGQGCILKEIAVSHFDDGSMKIRFDSDMLHYEIIENIFRHYFPRYDYIITGSTFSIKIQSQATLDTVLDFFHAINEKYNSQAIPKSIDDEIKNIYAWVHKDKSAHATHTIPEGKIVYSHVNPTRAHSKKLVELFKKVKFLQPGEREQFLEIFGKKFENHFNYLLAQGEDVNQTDDVIEETLIYHIIHLYNRNNNLILDNMLESIICYGIDLFRPVSTGFYKSAIEHAYEFATRWSISRPFQIITSALTTIEKPVTQPETPAPRLKVSKTEMSGNEDYIQTTFTLTNGVEIHTVVKDLGSHNAFELDAVYDIFKQDFALNNAGGNVKDEFNFNFHGKNKFLELIYANKSLIGYVLYELIPLGKNVILHCVISSLQPEYRGNMLMKLLIFRFAYCLQILLDNHHVLVFLSALHYNSYRLIKNHLHFPKYQPQYIEEIVKEILKIIFHGDFQYVHNADDVQKCYIIESLRVVESKTATERADIMRDFYLNHILGLNKSPQAAGSRSVPVLYYVSYFDYTELLLLCRLLLNIDFKQHTIDLANASRQFFSRYVPARVTPVDSVSNIFKANSSTFFQGASARNTAMAADTNRCRL